MSVKLSLTVSQPPMPSISSARTRVKAQRQPITNNPIAKTAAPHSAVAPSKRPVQPATMRHAGNPAMATRRATHGRASRRERVCQDVKLTAAGGVVTQKIEQQDQ